LTAAQRIDLNADVGEGFGPYTLGCDADLLPLVSSINVACGFHGGDPRIMDETVAAATRLGVAVGAHPGYWDLRGFGRRPTAAVPSEVEQDVLYQVGALLAFTRAHGVALTHVKPHGALYNQAALDGPLAAAVARGIARASPDLVVVGLANGMALREAAHIAGLRFAAEGFADRRYRRDGTLEPRSTPGAVVADPAAVAAQAVALATAQPVACADGSLLTVACETICVHGDTPGASAIARAVRDALSAARVRIEPLRA
jgi:5-oxoprolinase (ATP-hydrolysing) subunit A